MSNNIRWYEWKWSKGEAYYKSARRHNNANNDVEINDNKAISRSLNEGTYDEDSINITNTMFSRNQNASASKREDLDSRISDRDMVAQRGFNPFLNGNNYVNDITNRDMYLKPINTN